MRELVQTSDPILLSWLIPKLKIYGLRTKVSNEQITDVSGGICDTRYGIMVAAADYWFARVLLTEGRGELTNDALLGGRINLLQPKKGFRASIDSLLLAAAVPVKGTQKVLELGAGGGAAALALSARQLKAVITGVEKHPFMTALARYNAYRNRVENRVKFFTADIANGPEIGRKNVFDHVMANPPYMQRGLGNPSPYPMKALATVEGRAKLSDWVAYAVHAVCPGGNLVFIHRPERIEELINYLAPKAGEFVVIELFSKIDDQLAKRSLLMARKGGVVSTITYQRIVLHQNDGSFMPEVSEVLNNGVALKIN